MFIDETWNFLTFLFLPNEMKKLLKFKYFSCLSQEKFGLTSVMARKRAGRPPVPEEKWQASDEPEPSVASEDVEDLPEGIFTEPLDITKSEILVLI